MLMPPGKKYLKYWNRNGKDVVLLICVQFDRIILFSVTFVRSVRDHLESCSHRATEPGSVDADKSALEY
jgi:hypothetical protein